MCGPVEEEKTETEESDDEGVSGSTGKKTGTSSEEKNDEDGKGEILDSSGQIIDGDDESNDDPEEEGSHRKPTFSQRRAAKRMQKARAELRAQNLKAEFVDAYRRKKDSDRDALKNAVREAKQAMEDSAREHDGSHPSGDGDRRDSASSTTGTVTTTGSNPSTGTVTTTGSEPSTGTVTTTGSNPSTGTVTTTGSNSSGGDPLAVGDDDSAGIDPQLAAALAPDAPPNPIKQLSDALEQEENPVNKPSDGFYRHMKTTGYLMDLAGAATASASATENIIEAQASDEKNAAGYSERDDIKDALTPVRRISGGINAISGVVGGINNIWNFGKSVGAKKSHNKRVKSGANLGMLASGLGFFGNAAKIVTGGISAFGDHKDSDQKEASAWVGTVGNAFSTAASITTWVNNYRDRAQRKKLVSDTEDYVLDNAQSVSGSEEADTKTAAQAALQRRDLAAYSTNKTALNEIKAKKYAMQQAAAMNKVKSQQGPKGVVGSIVGGINTLASLVGAIAPGARLVTGAITGITNSIGNVVKQHELISDMNAKDGLKEGKMKVVNGYIRDKMDKLDNEISDYEGRTATPLNMTAKEKKRIIIARLGVNLEITDTEPSSSEMESAFDFINHKRALYIMNSSKAEREEMLAVLRLDNNATLKDIESVLRGD